MSWLIATSPSSVMNCNNFLTRTEPYTQKTFGQLLAQNEGRIYAIALITNTNRKSTSLVDFSELHKRIAAGGDVLDAQNQKITTIWISVIDPKRTSDNSTFIHKIAEQEISSSKEFLSLFALANNGNAASQFEFACKLDSLANIPASLYYLQLAADGGNFNAQITLSQTILFRFPNNAEYRKIGINCLRGAIAQEDNPRNVHAIHALGMYFYNSKEISEREEAFRLFQTAAAKDFTESEFMLAYCYLNSVGCTDKSDLAEQYYKRAADKGHHNAAYNYGQILLQRADKCADADEKARLLAEAKQVHSRIDFSQFNPDMFTKKGVTMPTRLVD